MFSLGPTEWEENYQDLSEWCAPSIRLVLEHPYAAPTDELNTPIIALETEGFHFNPILARREPKFPFESNQLGILPSEEREPSSYTSADFVPDNIAESYSPSLISPGSIASHTNATMAWDDGEFGFHERKTNFFISDLHQEDFMKKECSAPLALVEGKIGEEDFKAGLTASGIEINTPDIVKMFIDFPVKNEPTVGIAQINVDNNSNITCDGLGTPIDSLLLPQIEGEFDLLAYIDDSPKISPAASHGEQGTENLGQEEHIPCVRKIPTSLKIIDTQSNEYVTIQSVPSSSKITSHISEIPIVIKEESSSDDEVDEEDETYEPYKQTKGRKRVRKASKKEELGFALPLKRARRSTSASSEMTTASTSSDSKYRELRDRNNEASKRSRQSRKMRDGEMSVECSLMERKNAALKAKADEMEKLVKKIRQALLTAVTKKKK